MQGIRDMGNQRERRSEENKESIWGAMEEDCLNNWVNPEESGKYEEAFEWK